MKNRTPHAAPVLAKKKARRRGLVDVVIFLVGLGIFLYPLIINYMDYRVQQAAMTQYDEAVAKLTPQQIATMWSNAREYNVELGTPKLRDPFNYKNIRSPLDKYFSELNVDGKGMMAYVLYPRINMRIPLYHGTTDDVLLKGGGHIATTQLPTDQLSIHPVFTGHTGEIGHIFFDNLTQSEVGDVFQIKVLNRYLSFRVDKISKILPTDTTLLQPVKGKNYVTLLTCYPYGINDHRLLIRGEYIGDSIPPSPPVGAPLWFMWVFLGALLAAALALMWTRRRRMTCLLRLRDLSRLAAAEGSVA